MNTNYRERLGKELKETKSRLWIEQKMPKVKKRFNTKTKTANMDDEDSPNHLKV